MHLYLLQEDGTRRETLIQTIFLCKRWQGEPTSTPGVKPRWFTRDTLPYADMFEDTDAWLPKILDSEQILIEVLTHLNPQTEQHEVKDVLVRGVITP